MGGLVTIEPSARVAGQRDARFEGYPSSIRESFDTDAILPQLTERTRADLLAIGVHRRVRAGTTLIWQGGRGSGVAILLEGWVRLDVRQLNGLLGIVGLRGPGTLVGDEIMDGRPAMASVIALTDVLELVVSVRAFKDFVRREPEMQDQLYQTTLAHLRAAVEFQARVSITVMERLAYLLTDLVERVGTKGPEGIRISVPLSQADLAAMIGSTRESVARLLRRLRTAGVIRTGRNVIEVLDLDVLQRMRFIGDHL